MHLKKQGVVQDRLNRNHGRIESFDVAHLENPSVFFCSMEQGIGLRQIHSHRLLNENVEPHLQKPAAYFRVRDCRNGHARSIRASGQFL